MKPTKLDVITDTRGSLYEAFPVNKGQVFVININPGETRGNHYHLRKTEKFIVVSGSAEIVIRDWESGKTRKIRVDASKPTAVTVSPPNPHRITSEEGCSIVCWVSEKFNKDDTDTYPEVV